MQTVQKKDAMQRFMEDVQAALARNYAQRQAEMVKRGMRLTVLRGHSPTRPPLGYERTLTKGLFQPTSIGVILGTILQAIANESLPLSEAISILQTCSEARTGTRPNKQKILRLISNPYYAGKLIYRDKQYLGKHKALITLEQHRAILELLHNLDSKIAKTEATE